MIFDRRLLILVLAVSAHLLPTQARAQLDLRIEVEEDGVYEVTWTDLSPFLNGGSCEAERLVMKKGNIEVPIFVRAARAGKFSRTSSILFYGERNSSPHTRTTVYRLGFGASRSRLREVVLRPGKNPVNDAFVSKVFEEDRIFDPMYTVREDLLDLPRSERDHWFWERIPPRTKDNAKDRAHVKSIALQLRPKPRVIDASQATLEIDLRSHLGRKCKQSMTVEIDGKSIGSVSWEEANRHRVSFVVPPPMVKDFMVLTIQNTSKQAFWEERDNQVRQKFRNDILIDRVRLTYHTMLTGPTSKERHVIYDVEPTRRPRDVEYQFVSFKEEDFRIFDVASRTFFKSRRLRFKSDVKRRFIVVASDGFKQPRRIERWSERDLKRETVGGDWVVVTLRRFAEFLRPLTELRRSQGLQPIVVTEREICDSYAAGEFGPDAIDRFMADACARWKTKPRYLLLVGDADRDVDWTSIKRVLPTHLVPTYYNGLTASDASFTKDCPYPIPVGRIPVRRADELAVFARRIQQYETATEFGEWQKRINFIGSEGRFGPILDPIIERFATSLISSKIPAAYDVTMTYANPSSAYVYPPEEFNEKVISRFNEGALVYTYIGHGYKNGFDTLRVGRRRFPILTSSHVKQVNSGNQNPVMAVIACSTAHFDDPKEDCIGEQLMRLEGGPIGMIGATRISHPFPNSVLGQELIELFFAETPYTLGEVLLRAQTSMIENWKKSFVATVASSFMRGVDRDRLIEDHRHLYVLLGDPASRLARPRLDIAIEAPETATKGAAVEISGVLEDAGDGEAFVTIESSRGRIVHSVKRVSVKKKENYAQIRANYEAANNKVVARGEAKVVNGRFELKMAVPSNLPSGRYFVKAYIIDASGPHLGSRKLTLN